MSLDEIFSYKLKETGMSGLSKISEALGCEASCEAAPEEKREKQGGEI